MGDCEVHGTASDLHLLLWNRRGADGLDVQGDASLLTHWRDTVQIRWSRARNIPEPPAETSRPARS